MKLGKILTGLTLTGAGMLVYGALVESRNLRVERKTLPLEGWPERLNGFKIAVLGDLHVANVYSVRLAQQAVAMALDESPDMVVIPGDFVSFWKPETPWLLEEVLAPLLLMEGNVVAVHGNHDHYVPIDLLRTVVEEFNIKLLSNQTWRHNGITWVGIDSHNADKSSPAETMAAVHGEPVIALWHEPDLVDQLPSGAALQISGHSHGGQFRFPFGLVPMTSRNGKRYLGGFYPDAPTPLYVTRGVGTTGPPTRFLCPPEVSILTLVPKG